MSKVQRWSRTAVWMLASMMWATSQVWAQGAAQATDQVVPTRNLGASVLSTVLFGLLGIVLAIVGFKLFDIVIKFDLEREICEKQNLAAGILCGLMMLGICVIIAATVLS